jgi:hypothetical protein
MRNIRKLKEGDVKMVTELFPSLPPATISSYIYRHPANSTMDFIVHFLEEAEPTKQNISLQLGLLLAQARTVQRLKPPDARPVSAPPPDPAILEIQKAINLFSIPVPCKALSDRLVTLVGQLRIQKKRSRFQDEDYLTRMAFAYANELKLGYISLDSDNWEVWFNSHTDEYTDRIFACGFVPTLSDPVNSIGRMIDHDPEGKKFVSASVRFCGFGISISSKNSVFFALFGGNRVIAV